MKTTKKKTTKPRKRAWRTPPDYADRLKVANCIATYYDKCLREVDRMDRFVHQQVFDYCCANKRSLIRFILNNAPKDMNKTDVYGCMLGFFVYFKHKVSNP